jgi:hypothetical protein
LRDPWAHCNACSDDADQSPNTYKEKLLIKILHEGTQENQ